MNESLFVPVPPIWTGPVPGPLVSQVTVSTASPLVAAVAARRGQPQGPTNDPEVEELIYDTLELLSGAGDVEVRCEAGRVTLSGTVSHKRLKHDIGEIAWAIPVLSDVANNITIASRRRTRPFPRDREEGVAAAPGRKQA
ncbi:MAG TPA: BON domain-containing protein [Vicinamibacterales bacterium]|nr:BON domain-containing protein [Vicinamibacterales bacterium]